MCRCRYGNPKKKSRFICCKCLKENLVGSGIQRGSKQREKGHIKDLTCLCTGLKEVTKNIEVRYCDSFEEMLDKAEKLHIEYYGKVVDGYERTGSKRNYFSGNFKENARPVSSESVKRNFV